MTTTKTSYLAVYDDGKRDVWLRVLAESREQIAARHRYVTVVSEPPDWMTQRVRAELPTVDVDEGQEAFDEISRRDPAGLDALRKELSSQGFEVSREVESQSFGNRLFQFDRPDLGIRVIRDRGSWSIDLSIEAGPDDVWISTEVWRSCLEDRQPSADLRPIEEEIAFVIGNLGPILDLRSGDRWYQFVECLYEARSARGKLLRERLSRP